MHTWAGGEAIFLGLCLFFLQCTGLDLGELHILFDVVDLWLMSLEIFYKRNRMNRGKDDKHNQQRQSAKEDVPVVRRKIDIHGFILMQMVEISKHW